MIGGSARGIRLEAPGTGTRPLADRVKQTLFAILEPSLAGANVLDLFAGSGAAGIEALSRGAASATFVEHDRGAVAVITSNLGRARLDGPAVRVIREDVPRWLGRAAAPGAPSDRFDIVILDPPYDRPELLASALASLDRWVVPGGRVVAKHFWREAPPAVIGLLASDRERRFGETALTFYTRQEDR